MRNIYFPPKSDLHTNKQDVALLETFKLKNIVGVIYILHAIIMLPIAILGIIIPSIFIFASILIFLKLYIAIKLLKKSIYSLKFAIFDTTLYVFFSIHRYTIYSSDVLYLIVCMVEATIFVFIAYALYQEHSLTKGLFVSLGRTGF